MTTKGRRGRAPGVNGGDAIPAATPSEYGVEMATRRTVKRTAAKTGKTAMKKVARKKAAAGKSTVKSAASAAAARKPPATQKVAARQTTAQKAAVRPDEQPSELQSLIRLPFAVLCMKEKKHIARG